MVKAWTLARERTQQVVSPDSVALRQSLQVILSRAEIPGLPITGLERRASDYSSSFPLEEIRVSFADGTALVIIFKDLSRQSLTEAVRQAKPEFLYDPLREIETYRTVLAKYQLSLGTARYYGAVVNDDAKRYWLFLEKVLADELYKIGEFSTWEHVARWLAGMHHTFALAGVHETHRSAPWLSYDAKYFRQWMHRAQEISSALSATHSAEARRKIDRLAQRYDRVVERLISLPRTFIHGEFYASNVLIAKRGEGLRVCPIDWEMAAFGPGLIDLAALVSGRWTDAQRTAMALAYRDALRDLDEIGFAVPEAEAFLSAIDDCRLHLAIQWLGWSANWTPPAEHAQDWLEEALSLAEKVGCL